METEPRIVPGLCFIFSSECNLKFQPHLDNLPINTFPHLNAANYG